MIDLDKLSNLNHSISRLRPGELLRYEQLDEEIYHAANGCGSTMLKWFIDAPRKYKAARDGEFVFSSDSLDIGSATHALVLEPELFDDKFAMMPPDLKKQTGKGWEAFREKYETVLKHKPESFDSAFIMMPDTIKRKAGKEWEAFKAANEDKAILSASEWEKTQEMKAYWLWENEHGHKTKLTPAQMIKCRGMRSVVMDTHGKYFKKGGAEVSYFRRHASGVVIKARIDYEIDDLCVDLKTTKDADPEKWSNSAVNYGYHLQRALYLECTGKNEMVFVCVENEAPYLTSGPFLMSEELKELAYLQVDKALKQLAECTELDYWPGYNTGPQTLEAKPWHLQQLAKLKGAL